MKEISIQKGEGVSQAIKRQLKNEGVQEEQFKGSVWSKIQASLKDNESTITHNGNESKIGDLWTTLKTNVKTYVNDILKIADKTWEYIKGLFDIKDSEAVDNVKEDDTVDGTEETGPVDETDETNETENNENTDSVEAPSFTFETKPTSAVEDHTRAAKSYVAELKELFGKTPVPMGKVKQCLEKAAKNNLTAYIVQQYPELADKIDGVFRFGAGFDKKDVFDMVLEPLMKRADDLKISYNKEGLFRKMDFTKMKEAITKLSQLIIEKETSIDAENAEYNEQASKAEEKANKALGKLAEAANTRPEVQKYEEHKCKQCTLSDGTVIQANYDESGKIENVVVVFGDDKLADDNGSVYANVAFSSNGIKADLDGKTENGLEFNQKPNNYDYNAILEIAKQIFGEWED